MNRTSKAALGVAILIGATLLGLPSAGAKGAPDGDARTQQIFQHASDAFGAPEGRASTKATASVHSPYAAFDTKNDTIYKEGDIVSYGIVHRGNIALSLRNQIGTNPFTSSPWVDGFTFAGWGVGIKTDGKINFLVTLFNDGAGNLKGEVRVNNSPTFTKRCNATVQFYGGNGYRAVFSRQCINAPNYFRVNTAMFFDKQPFNPNAPISEDRGPNSNSSGLVLGPYVHPG